MLKFIAVVFLSAIFGVLLGIVFLNIPYYFSREITFNATNLGPIWVSPVKHAIQNALSVGITLNTVVLLLLLPVIATFIAGARHIIGLRSFGIFLPAALAVVFVALGPLPGITLFLLIVLISTLVRFSLRRVKLRLQYLPRMAFILWAIVLVIFSILLAAPYIRITDLSAISIFPVFILILLAEDFTRVQLGKSVKTAINLTTETLILALSSYLILSFVPLQEFAIGSPEILLVTVAVIDFVLGKYIGLRFLEFWRFRKLINS